MDIILNIASFIIIISFLVFVHEFGHYYVAKISGVHVEQFSIGFGKKIISWHDKSGTEWKWCMIPLGGYVKMYGDSDVASSALEITDNITESDKKKMFFFQPLRWKMAIVAAGPAANYILSIIIFVGFFLYYGKLSTLPVISSVEEKTPAYEAGLLPNDKIKKINSTEINDFTDIQKILMMNRGEELNIIIERNFKELSFDIHPAVKNISNNIEKNIQQWYLGIGFSEITHEQVSLPKSIILAMNEVVFMSYANLKGIWQIITNQRSTDELGGPIKIAKYSAQSVKQGVASILWFTAIISLNLGLINLLPIPMLDGGHLFFYFIELIIQKPINTKIKQISFQLGGVLLLLIFCFTTFNDLSNIFN